MIEKITIDLGGIKVELTLEQAKALKNELDFFLGSGYYIYPNPYPYYPWPYYPTTLTLMFKYIAEVNS